MDNLLLQVKGRKRVVLYSPQDATYLYLNGMYYHRVITWITMCIDPGVGVVKFDTAHNYGQKIAKVF